MTRHEDKLALQIVRLDPQKALDLIEDSSSDAKEHVGRSLEGLAEWATWLAAYVEERHGHGCGDQGHERAVRRANRASRILWCKAFGYNAFFPRNPRNPK